MLGVELVTQHANERVPSFARLVDQLDAFEWRNLQEKLSPRDFRRDIFGDLPVELRFAVLDHLEFEAPVLYQTVRC